MRRWLLVLLAVVVGLPLAGAAGVLVMGEALLNTASIRGWVQEAVQRATGHPVDLGGRLGLAWSLSPSVVVRDATLLNGPGFSRPAFARVRRIEVTAGLVPGLSGRFEVRGVTIEGADVLLERDAQGRGNWSLPAGPPVGGAGAGVGAGAGARAPVSVGRVVVLESRVAWLGAPPMEVARLVGSPSGGPVEGIVGLRGVQFTIAGRTGPVERMPIAVDLTAVGGGLAVSVAGEVGGVVGVQALVPDLAALQGLAGRALPSVKGLAFGMQAGAGGVQGLSLVAGASEVGAGVRLVKLEAKAAGLDQPVTVTGEGAFRGLPVVLSVNLGSPASLFGGGRLAFQALALGDGASLAMQGAVDVATVAVDATVAASVPDLRRTGALAGMVLPAARDVSLNLRVLPGPGGAGWLARGVRLSMAQGDVSGDLAFGVEPRPYVRGSLQSQRLDIDGLLVVAPGVAVPGPAAVAPGAAPVTPQNLVPAMPLPFAALRLADADLRLAAGLVAWRGAAYRAVEARVLLQDGRLRVDPAQAQVSGPGGVGGPVQAQITADANASPPSVGLMLRGAGLEAAAVGGGDALTGTLDLDVQLVGAGADLRSLVASAQGRAGVALVDGDVENQSLVAMFGPVLRAANLPTEAQGRSRVRCMAVRIDAAGGIARVAALGLDATRLKLEGEGAVNLVDETLEMNLRPTIRIGPTGVAIPVRLTGPIRAPKPELLRGAIAAGRVGISIGGASPDPCPGALTAARDGRAGRMP